jgi:hypothetical protein
MRENESRVSMYRRGLEATLSDAYNETTQEQLDTLWEQAPNSIKYIIAEHTYRTSSKNYEWNDLSERVRELWIPMAKPLFETIVRTRAQQRPLEVFISEPTDKEEFLAALELVREWITTVPQLDMQANQWDGFASNTQIARSAFRNTVRLAISPTNDIDTQFIAVVINRVAAIRDITTHWLANSFVVPFKDNVLDFPAGHEDISSRYVSETQDVIFAINEEMLRHRMFRGATYFNKINTIDPLKVDFRYAIGLLNGLKGNGTIDSLEYLPSETKVSGDQYLTIANNIMSSVLRRARTVNDRARNIYETLDSQRVGETRSKLIPHTAFIQVAQAWTIELNKQGGILIDNKGNRKLLTDLSTTSIDTLAESFYRFLYVIYGKNPDPNNELYQQDMVYAELVDMIAAKGLELNKKKQVLTIGDIIARFPEATPDEIQRMKENYQKGQRVSELHDWFRKQREHGRSSYWNRWKQGGGALS